VIAIGTTGLLSQDVRQGPQGHFQSQQTEALQSGQATGHAEDVDDFIGGHVGIDKAAVATSQYDTFGTRGCGALLWLWLYGKDCG